MKFFPNHEQIEKWEFVLTIVITVIIAAELVIAVLGMLSGNQELTSLQSLSASASAQSDKLKALTDEEAQSVAKLQDMNVALQTSMQETTDMSHALRSQLAIVRDEQQRQLAELAKKPLVTMSIGSVLTTNTTAGIAVPSREMTSTRAVYELTITNAGTATLLYYQMRVVVDGAGVTLKCDCPSQPIPATGEISTTQNGLLISADRLRQGIHVTMKITAEFPKETPPFRMQIAIDGDNYPLTVLGTFLVIPPKD